MQLTRIQTLWVNRFNPDEVCLVIKFRSLIYHKVFVAARIRTEEDELILIRGYRTKNQLLVSLFKWKPSLKLILFLVSVPNAWRISRYALQHFLLQSQQWNIQIFLSILIFLYFSMSLQAKEIISEWRKNINTYRKAARQHVHEYIAIMQTSSDDLKERLIDQFGKFIIG